MEDQIGLLRRLSIEPVVEACGPIDHLDRVADVAAAGRADSILRGGISDAA
jgi:hypothetical protein